MPVGIQRLNARHSQPNPHIVFIKPLKGPDEDVARQFLERIAAQCVPIMRTNHLSVMTLEEYEPNAEFVGRNFNGGEVIQLVLKTRGPRRARQWLPFAYVQMVMMHELAHCKQMNHSRAFWAVRNTYAEAMRALWSAKYTGEGIWGRGAVLGTPGTTPLYERNVVADDDEALLVEHLCGGTYRSRRRKRKAAGSEQQQLTYRERQDRRIKRKFGVNGVALGDDLDERAKRETSNAPGSSSLRQTTLTPGQGDAPQQPNMTKAAQKRLATKPRVAVSKRGRELRAAAALARFDQAKEAKEAKEAEEAAEKLERQDELDDILAIKREGEAKGDSRSDGDDEDYDDDDDEPDLIGPDAVDIDGSRLVDDKGRSMVRVCEGMGDGSDGGDGSGGDTGGADDARRELRELMQGPGWASQSALDLARNPGLYGIPAWVAPQPAAPAPKPAITIRKLAPQPAAPTSAPAPAPAITITKLPPRPAAPAPAPAPAITITKLSPRPAAPAPKPAITITKLAPRPAALAPEPAPATTTKLARQPTASDSKAGEETPRQTDADCPVCGYANDGDAITCDVCGHVQHPDAVTDAWHCDSAACQPVEGAVRYLNAGDCGVCGVCGARRHGQSDALAQDT